MIGRVFFLSLLMIIAGASAVSATTTATFSTFSVTYDSSQLGSLQFPAEFDAFTLVPPVTNFGIARFFFSPPLSANTGPGPSSAEVRIQGDVVLTAKPGWRLYNAKLIQSGRWHTVGDGSVDLGSSHVDVDFGGAAAFFDIANAYTAVLASGSEGTDGYYYVAHERSTFAALADIVIHYDINLRALAPTPLDSAAIGADAADSTTLGTLGPYGDANYNVVGTFVSLAVQRAVPEPSTPLLLGVALVAMTAFRRLMR